MWISFGKISVFGAEMTGLGRDVRLKAEHDNREVKAEHDRRLSRNWFEDDRRNRVEDDGVGKGKIAVAGNFSKLGKVVCAAGLGGKGKKNFLLRV